MAELLDLGEGIHQVTLPLPLASPSSVNCYLIEGDNGLTLIDCGVLDPATLATLEDAIAEVCGGEPELDRLIGSHLHPDHMAAASEIVDRYGCEFVMHSTTQDQIDGYNDWTKRRDEVVDLVRIHGADEESIAAFGEVWPRPEWAGEAIPPTRPVRGGDTVALGANRELAVVYTPGHHITHICLLDSVTGHLFSGDHVLPRITPYIALDPEGNDALGSFLHSLGEIEDIDPGLTYPAHGAIIEQGRARARQIALHHERRIRSMLDQTRRTPLTAWQIMKASFRPDLDTMNQYLAFQETLAHLDHMVKTGRTRRIEDGTQVRFGR